MVLLMGLGGSCKYLCARMQCVFHGDLWVRTGLRKCHLKF